MSKPSFRTYCHLESFLYFNQSCLKSHFPFVIKLHTKLINLHTMLENYISKRLVLCKDATF
ncbi:hypothetical protein HCCG_00688 [Helicobacter cinaedi CCUG 18818 = ATCC BAA-847]|uniref:Uncharacterized protein n=1 Tax=Helicobacter cinaedi CCUG 18818 = ATCC BAA-847 TaxID=537971 RepID=A0ABN0B9L0_9HELI|nr:hypothetical protein HCCG_00688 [Helicobacter cinaedi CCUG 18818 = ATCC BAA-847]